MCPWVYPVLKFPHFLPAVLTSINLCFGDLWHGLILIKHWGKCHKLTGWKYFVVSVAHCLIQDDQVIYCFHEHTLEGQRNVVTGKPWVWTSSICWHCLGTIKMWLFYLTNLLDLKIPWDYIGNCRPFIFRGKIRKINDIFLFLLKYVQQTISHKNIQCQLFCMAQAYSPSMGF